ncbi:uncharacterized protein TRAVEDRAFT_54531 [Trametes versicolor FP-101664 SS1]|uniref:Uncharacterized protein n=1 Tax=Trametes versicolor (strain FP-101664) TaxID=717944 RepID=R7S6D7_TRAVS|nr:uncharacterized protein TRAVEDRAFT_54531 [Trametes versicolor FP-101664 SS1]EIW51493.1 hypothetical protein TRAVEDRAFT_54531 [Trametes versicolor FP-101664 SS1]
MIETVFDHLHVETLLRMRATGAVADEYISTYLHRKLVGFLRHYVENPHHFLDELETCCSVICGSAALAILFRHPWKACDLDVYIPRDFVWHVIAYLVNVEQYTVEFLGDPDYTAYGDIRSVARMSRADGRRVNVIQSESNSPLLPIASFWNTAVMNYITPTNFCIAYPLLTDELCALTTTVLLLEDGVSGATFPFVGHELVKKYEDHGFSVHADHTSWARSEDPSASCPGMGTPHCPLTMRYFGDQFCVTGAIHAIRGRRTPRTLPNDFLGKFTAVWWRGGHTCGGECAKAGKWLYSNSYSCVRTLLMTSDV